MRSVPTIFAVCIVALSPSWLAAQEADSQDLDLVEVPEELLDGTQAGVRLQDRNLSIGDTGNGSTPIARGRRNVFIGNYVARNATTANATTAVGHHAGEGLTTARTGAFFGYNAGQFTSSGASNSFFGAYCGQGFEVDRETGLIISGTNPLTGGNNSGFGEACLLSIRGTARGNSAYGYNSLFGLTYASFNNAFGMGAGLFLTGIKGDGRAQSLNAMFGTGTYKWGSGQQNSFFGNNAGSGHLVNTKLAGSVAKGSKIVPVADTSVFRIGGAIYSGGFMLPGSKVVNIVPGGGGLVAPAGTIESDTASFSSFDFSAVKAPMTIVSIPYPHSGRANVGLGFNALGDIAGEANFNIGIGISSGRSLNGGSDNILIGRNAGSTISTGSGNFLVGPSVSNSVPSASNELNLGNTIYGVGLNDQAPDGLVGIEVPHPKYTLHVGGTFASEGTAIFKGGMVQNIKIVEDGNPVILSGDDKVLIVKSTTATSVTLPATPERGQTFTIKDGSGKASHAPITITAPMGTVDGSPTRVISADYGVVTVIFDGTAWFSI